jgi:hypothetical protein
MAPDLASFAESVTAVAALEGFLLGLAAAQQPNPFSALGEVATGELTLVDPDEPRHPDGPTTGSMISRERGTARMILQVWESGRRGVQVISPCHAVDLGLSEQDFRRHDFRGGVPVVMKDGREWYIPTSAAPRLAPLVADFFTISRREIDGSPDRDAPKSIAVLGRIISELVSLNYTIDAATICALTDWPAAEDDDSALRWHQMLLLARGENLLEYECGDNHERT